MSAHPMLNFTCRRVWWLSNPSICAYAYAECGGNLAASVRPHWGEGGRVCLTRYITIAMVDMLNVLFGTTTCLDDKGNPPFLFSFFFFSSFFLFLFFFWGGEVRTFKVQGKRRRSGKTNERDERDELQMLKWKNDRV